MAEIAKDLSNYIDNTVDPNMAGFISQYKTYSVNKEYLSHNFSDIINRSITKQEAFLLKQFDKPTMAIFRLKQPIHGYTDRQDIRSENISINVDVKASDQTAADFTEYLKSKNS